MHRRVLTFIAATVMSLSACSSGGSGATSPTSGVADANYAAATKAAACARVVTLKSQVAQIEKQAFQAVRDADPTDPLSGTAAGELRQQEIPLNKEMTAQRLVCAGPTGQSSAAPSAVATTTASATTAPSSGPTAVPVDPAKVAALQSKISANPQDTASLQSLGDVYFAANDYTNASV